MKRLGGKQGIFNTYKALVYGYTPLMLLGEIPYAGILGLLYGLYLATVGVSTLHKMDMWRSFFGIIVVPVAVAIALSFLIIALGLASLGVLGLGPES